MSEQTAKVDDSLSPKKIIKKLKKGDLVKVEREKYVNSLESKSSDKKNEKPKAINSCLIRLGQVIGKNIISSIGEFFSII